jgi:hypothetical protein
MMKLQQPKSGARMKGKLDYSQICQDALNTFGWRHQFVKCMTELSELSQRLGDLVLDYGTVPLHDQVKAEMLVVEEIVDVGIMLRQVEMHMLESMFIDKDTFTFEHEHKMDRLKTLIEKHVSGGYIDRPECNGVRCSADCENTKCLKNVCH